MIQRRSLIAGAGCAAALAALPAQAARRRFFDRIARPIGIQLYALGEEAQKDPEGTLHRLGAIGYRDVELPGLMGHKAEDLRRFAQAAGLQISSVHVPVNGELSIRSDAQRMSDILGILGARQLVVPMFPIPPGFRAQPGESLGAALARTIKVGGEDFWKQLAGLLNERAAAIRPHGISLGYHNHNIEFLSAGTRTGWDVIVAETDPALVHFEADIGWIVSAGVDPLAFFTACHGRVREVHVKDVKRGFRPTVALGTDPTEVGTGQVDWSKVLPAAYKAGARHFYVEQEPPFTLPRMDSVARSYAYLAALRT